MSLITSCSTWSRQYAPPPELKRVYEISKDGKHLFYTYTCETTIFGNVKKLCPIKVEMTAQKMKDLKGKGFRISIPKKENQ